MFRRLNDRGFEIEKRKVGENNLYSTLVWKGEKVRLEALFKEAQGELMDYETAEEM